MLNKLFAKPMELTVGEQTLKFSSIADFEFCMTGRTSVPSKKITQMVKFSLDQLKKEARVIKEVEKCFVAILSRSIEDSNSIGRAIKELDSTIFSQDHSWRLIITALNQGDGEFNPFRRIALVKYMQYLSSRQEIIKYLYSERQKLSNEPVQENGDTDAPGPLKDTLILENTLFEADHGASNRKGLERMPKGEAVIITLASGKEFDIMLSKHKCKLSSKNGIQFVDQTGKSHVLNKGRNAIGRDSAGTVKIDSALRDVSRLHLVIENLGDNNLQITDMSSHGTFIPSNLIETTNV
ncbi:MAG: FHA domain-containing protein [Gammaproteobacteria bacterium]